MCINVLRGVSTQVHDSVGGRQRLMSDTVSGCSPLYLPRQGLLLNLELAHCSQLVPAASRVWLLSSGVAAVHTACYLFFFCECWQSILVPRLAWQLFYPLSHLFSALLETVSLTGTRGSPLSPTELCLLLPSTEVSSTVFHPASVREGLRMELVS